MSFGYGVGDVMAVSRLALKVIIAYKDAPGDYRNISDEVESLHIIIKKAAQHFESTSLGDDSRQEGQKVLKGCQNVLEDLDTLIEKYNSLASASASASTSTSQVLQRMKLGASQVLGTEDIATLRARLTSNTTMLNGFIQSCDSNEMRARLDNILGLHRTTSRDSMVSLAGSVNTKQAYKRFIKGLFAIGVTADMINDKEKEIQDIFKPQHPAASSRMDEVGNSSNENQLPEVLHPSDQNEVPEVGNPSDENQLSEIRKSSNQNDFPEVGSSSSPETSTMSTENPRSQSRFGWVRPPIDFLVGPLMLAAAEAGNTKRLISTLEYVRNINFADDYKETALHKAATNGYKEIVQILLLKGASTEAMTKYDRNPLHCAAGRGHTSTVELLISKGASIEARGITNWTPLHLAASSGHPSTVELLLSKGGSIEAEIILNWTPLHCAAEYGHPRTVELLLSKGASIEARNNYYQTPLHCAANRGHTSTVELLLSKDASIAARDKYNNTPFELARRNHPDTAKLLKDKAAELPALETYELPISGSRRK